MNKLLALILLVTASVSTASPLRPIKLDSPRDTMKSYVEAMNDYIEGLKTNDNAKLARLSDAVRTMDLSSLPLLARKDKGEESAILMKEVLDRVILINLDLVPDEDRERWRLKDTEIVIKKMTEGDHAGEYLFSSETIFRMEEFYQKVRKLPYLEGSDGGAGYKEPWVERNVPNSWRGKFWGIEKWKFLGIFISILVGFVIKTIAGKIVLLFKNTVGRKDGTTRRKVIQAVEEPSGLIFATAFWFFSIQVMKFDGKFLAFLMGLVQVVLSIAIIWAAYRMAGVLSDYLKALSDKTDTDLDDHLVPLLTKSLRAFIVVIGVLVTIQNLGFNVMSLLAGLGLGGLAFALAAKDTAANLFGSLMILFDRPFKVGEWIKTNSAEGTVEEIGFRSTRLRTFYNSQISIPNSALANENIDNMGRRRYRRIKTELGLTYDTTPEKLHEFVEGIRKILQDNENIWQDNYHVYFNSYGASSLNVFLYCFLDVPDWSTELAEKEKIYTEILKLAANIGVSFAFPSTSLYVESLPDSSPAT